MIVKTHTNRRPVSTAIAETVAASPGRHRAAPATRPEHRAKLLVPTWREQAAQRRGRNPRPTASGVCTALMVVLMLALTPFAQAITP